jgi:hypothetical protein
MPNFRAAPPKQKLRLKQGRFPDNGVKGINSVELKAMPNASHLTCPMCGNYKLGVNKSLVDEAMTSVGCGGCGWESKIEAQILPKDFTGSCPRCLCHEFIIMKLDNHVGCGCAKCSWESTYRVAEDKIIIPGK